MLIHNNGSTVTDTLFGLLFGAEYFLDQQFSVGGELQLNMTFSDKSSNRFGNPNGTNVNNGTALHATFYFWQLTKPGRRRITRSTTRSLIW